MNLHTDYSDEKAVLLLFIQTRTSKSVPSFSIPVEKSDVVVSIALNVAGLRCYVLRFYSIFLVICFSTGVPW